MKNLYKYTHLYFTVKQHLVKDPKTKWKKFKKTKLTILVNKTNETKNNRELCPLLDETTFRMQLNCWLWYSFNKIGWFSWRLRKKSRWRRHLRGGCTLNQRQTKRIAMPPLTCHRFFDLRRRQLDGQALKTSAAWVIKSSSGREKFADGGSDTFLDVHHRKRRHQNQILNIMASQWGVFPRLLHPLRRSASNSAAATKNSFLLLLCLQTPGLVWGSNIDQRRTILSSLVNWGNHRAVKKTIRTHCITATRRLEEGGVGKRERGRGHQRELQLFQYRPRVSFFCFLSINEWFL